MIHVLTTEQDFSTMMVVDWLNYKGVEFLILHPEDDKQVLLTDNKNNKKNTFWFRKWEISQKSGHCKEAYLMQLNSFHDLNCNSFWLNSPKDLYKNKGIQLIKAKEIGFKIPKTIITKDKETIKEFIQINDKSILKLNNALFHKINNSTYLNYVQLIDIKSIEKLEISEPCIIQEYVEKLIEIRVFYLNNLCFSMAIFSQNDPKTKIDFRNYNSKRPNRTVPLKLPKKIEGQVDALMKSLEMNSGSLDIIFTPNEEYVFLEVNPLGQFGMVSYPCNYNLEEKVANILIKNDAND